MASKANKTGPATRAAAKGGAGKPAVRHGRVAKVSWAASSFVSKAIRAKGFAEAEVVTRWGQIVGSDLARATVPIRLQFPRGERVGATLHVRTESAFAPILQQRTHHVIELVNRYLGYAAVARIEMKHGSLMKVEVRQPLEKQPLKMAQKEQLNGLVGDGELSPLKLALKSLGEYVLSGSDEKK